MTQHRDSLPSGSPLLGEYRVETVLGQDEFTVTYLALEPLLDRNVLITEYLPGAQAARSAKGRVAPESSDSAAAYAAGLRRFLAGARDLAGADQPQAVKVHRIAEANGTAYLVTEHVTGRGLVDELEVIRSAMRHGAPGGEGAAAVAPARKPSAPRPEARKRAIRPHVFNRRRIFYAAGVAVVSLGVVVTVSVARRASLTPEQRAAAMEARLELSAETIELVETGLFADGHHSGEPDGVLDPDVRVGLREWQASRSIEATGYLDRESLSELVAAGRAVTRQAEVERREAEAAQLAEERRRAQEQRLAEARRRAQDQQLEAEQRESARAEADRLEAESLEAERLEEERLEAERLEAERLEAERLEAERLEAERLEAERLEAERLEAERLEAERLAEARQRLQAQRLAEAQRRLLLSRGDNELLLDAGSALGGGPASSLNWSRHLNWVSWTGVNVTGDAVTGIDLADQGLGGTIPESLGFLGGLQYLNLADNQLSGEIPAELGRLNSLEFLYLQGNALSGRIPPELGSLSMLEDLYLQGNALSGSIPGELGNLRSLRRMILSSTRIEGGIPPELGRLEGLEVLSLDRNQLSGSIPAELANLSNLKRLSLSYNRLSGCIPEALSRFESNINPQADGMNLPRCTDR